MVVLGPRRGVGKALEPRSDHDPTVCRRPLPPAAADPAASQNTTNKAAAVTTVPDEHPHAEPVPLRHRPDMQATRPTVMPATATPSSSCVDPGREHQEVGHDTAGRRRSGLSAGSRPSEVLSSRLDHAASATWPQRARHAGLRQRRCRRTQEDGPGGSRPAAYSCIGTWSADHALITGSMIRLDASASSLWMNSIGSFGGASSESGWRTASSVARAGQGAGSRRASADRLAPLSVADSGHPGLGQTDPEYVPFDSRPLFVQAVWHPSVAERDSGAVLLRAPCRSAARPMSVQRHGLGTSRVSEA